MRLLLLEDTPDVAEAVVASFARSGAAVDHAASVADARDLLAVQSYEVLVLDINLPDGSGTDLLAELRRAGNTVPVLMLTAQFEVEDRVAALDSGADDYLVKPFDLRELEARVRALARREGSEKSGAMTLGRLSFDPAARMAQIDDADIALTRRELSLLETLLRNHRRVMSKERIFDSMFSFDDSEVGLNAVEIYIARLRKKLDGSGVAIRTLRGLGYQLVTTDAS
ncbi:MAG TPA: response regulator transcription factor [Paracoccaceae bacterium]|nr:response regulator transcription factor [Paracoccaceae bacterium]